ncbi:cytochrome P450 9e2-like isoform X1 [Choristoneura fumiferana]|uniref:cytochrome P450 9e2-like isoform X1 n=1 Tax=Choristoneura fumiferana TaxID=7141 RepID=UPI003D15704F
MIFFVCIGALLTALVLYTRQIYSRFSEAGVRHFRPIPLVGTAGKVVIRIQHLIDSANDVYTTFLEDKFVGQYLLLKPIIYVKDLALIKKITVKDFEYFLNHQGFVSEEVDPIFGRNLFSLRGKEWKDMRFTLSPVFTSSKMKHMLPFMAEVGDQMISSLTTRLHESGKTSMEIDAKDIAARYANDVIATCAFGLKVDSQSGRNNHFYRMGDKATNFGFKALLTVLGYGSVPRLMKMFKVALFPEDVRDFFKQLVLNTMNERKAHNIVRPDIIHLLMETKKGQQLTYAENSANDTDAGFDTVGKSTVGKRNVDTVWSDNDLTAQAALFFVGGFETISTAMTFLMYELAVNPEIQERLVQEIKDHDKANDGKFDYNSIRSMTYLDMVVSEVLRLWPPAIASERLCVKEYNLGKPYEKAPADYIVKVNDSIHIPIFSIHRDPRYFPNPLKFDPERFSDENKHKIQPFTYMPFGVGPRNCLGSRFALCEVKVMIYLLLQHMKLEPSKRTPIPLELAAGSFSLRMRGGHWLQLRARD